MAVSAAVGAVRVARTVDCPPRVSLSPQATRAETAPPGSGWSTTVPVFALLRPSAATKAGSVEAGPSVSTVASRSCADSAGSAKTARASIAIVALSTRGRPAASARSASGEAFGANPVSRVTSAAPATHAQTRLRALPGQIATATGPTVTTEMPTTRNAVASPASATTSSTRPAIQRLVKRASTASTPTGASSTSSHTAGTVWAQGPNAPARSSAPQPPGSMVGEPAASSARPAASAVACGPAQGTPGSASSAQRLFSASRRKTSGAAIAIVGMTTQMTRAAPWPRRTVEIRTSSTSHTSTSAGASDGAQATTAANSRDAAPDALHERWATVPV